MTRQSTDIRRVIRAARKAREASEARDGEIREAAKTHSIRAVAVAAGLSSSRVHQIIHGR